MKEQLTKNIIHFEEGTLKMSRDQYLNYLAIHLLMLMENHCPTQVEIDEVETCLRQFLNHKICQSKTK